MAEQNHNNIEDETGIEPEPAATETVRLADIVFDLDAQARTEPLNEKTVEQYADDLANGAEFPPIELVRDPSGKLYCADGFHRGKAYIRSGRTEIRARIRPGTLAEARLANGRANLRHGLPMSREDRRRQAIWLLRQEEYRAKSDRWIATACGLSHPTIARLREQDAKLERCDIIGATAEAESEPEYRVGSDGIRRRVPTRTREQNLAKFDELPDAEYLNKHRDKQWPDSAGPIQLNRDRPAESIQAGATRLFGFVAELREQYPTIGDLFADPKIVAMSAEERDEFGHALLMGLRAAAKYERELSAYLKDCGLVAETESESEAEADYGQAL